MGNGTVVQLVNNYCAQCGMQSILILVAGSVIKLLSLNGQTTCSQLPLQNLAILQNTLVWALEELIVV